MKTRSTLFLFLFITAAALTSCSKALSDEHVKYVGSWGDDKYALEIWKNGNGVYQKKQQQPINCIVKIKNNRIKFQGVKTFSIDVDPYVNQEGFTVMVLDGRTFYKH